MPDQGSWTEIAYRTVLDALGLGVMVVGATGRFVYVNDAALALIGVPEGLDPGMKIDQWPQRLGIHDIEGRALLAPRRVPLVRALGGETVQDATLMIRNEGRPEGIRIRVSARPVLVDGEPAGAMMVLDDMTARLEAERERRMLDSRVRESQRLESLAVLAGGIAHDFNNLLMGVLGNADAAAASLPADSPARAPISHVSDAALRAADLARQMLAYAGQGRLTIEPIDLSRLVQEMVPLLRSAIPRNVELQLELADDLPLAEGDLTQLRQVVMNLITNAADACRDEGGTITLRTRGAQHSADWLRRTWGAELQPGYYLTLEVDDDGVGMDPETRRHIFDPFFTTKDRGRGLGLAAALGIIRTLDGAIRVQSEPGRGTRFQVILPAGGGVRRGHSGPIKAGEDEWRGQGTVLLVDDEPLVRRAAGRMLRSLGFSVVEAEDGHGAITWLRDNPDDAVAVLLDMSMPGLSGADVFAEIHDFAPHLPVIMSSGRERNDVLERLHEEGLAAFLPKPYRLAELRTTLREILTAREDGP